MTKRKSGRITLGATTGVIGLEAAKSSAAMVIISVYSQFNMRKSQKYLFAYSAYLINFNAFLV